MHKHCGDRKKTGLSRMASVVGDLRPANSHAGVVNAIMRFVYGLLAEVPMWSQKRMASSQARRLGFGKHSL